MIRKLVIFLSLGQYQIQCKPVLPCPQEVQSDIVNLPELSLLGGEPEYSSEIIEPGTQQISTQCQCCNPPVLVSCVKQEQLPVTPKLSRNEGDKILSSIFGGDSDAELYNSNQLRSSSDSVCSSPDATSRTMLEEQRSTERKNRMFEGLLKLTTILNRFDTFVTKKAKGLLKGIHSMIQSEEDEGKYY